MRFTIFLALGLMVCPGAFPQTSGVRRTPTQVLTPHGSRQPRQQQASEQPKFKPEDYAKVEGTVLDANTGAPLKKARLMMYGTRPGHRTRLSAVTDASGRFLFPKVEPGKYRLSVRRNRYASQSYGQKKPGTAGALLTVAARQHIKDVVFKLVPGAVVTGRVVDEDGEPVPYVSVSVKIGRAHV